MEAKSRYVGRTQSMVEYSSTNSWDKTLSFSICCRVRAGLTYRSSHVIVNRLSGECPLTETADKRRD